MNGAARAIDEIRRGFRNQPSVIFALLFKDFRVRASWGRLGIIYAFFQPAIALVSPLFLCWGIIAYYDNLFRILQK